MPTITSIKQKVGFIYVEDALLLPLAKFNSIINLIEKIYS